jgi:hypothetical protein
MGMNSKARRLCVGGDGRNATHTTETGPFEVVNGRKDTSAAPLASCNGRIWLHMLARVKLEAVFINTPKDWNGSISHHLEAGSRRWQIW